MGAVPSFVTVFSGSSIEASLVLSFLESHGIAAQIEGEYMGVTAPYAGAGDGAGAVKVNVPANDAAEAQEILANRTSDAPPLHCGAWKPPKPAISAAVMICA